jgi:cyclopropane-fatty-acyl-phospholipid synthase
MDATFQPRPTTHQNTRFEICAVEFEFSKRPREEGALIEPARELIQSTRIPSGLRVDTQRPDPSGQPDPRTYEVIFREGQSEIVGEGESAFRLFVRDRRYLERFWRMDAYTAATAFVRGEYDVEGDLVAAIAVRSAGLRNWKDLVFAALARFSPARLESLFQTKARAARNIRHHYDCSNHFYQQFLDSRMVYSCAYFRDPEWSLEQAQLAKLDHICHKLDIRRGESFLDIGCGWGALVLHAADRFGAFATGCTLSKRQFEYALNRVQDSAQAGRISILETDYRDLTGSYDKIASVGMFEHVGRRRLETYFRKVGALLGADGLFLNHGIIRPQLVSDGPETLFLRRRVFPGGELPHLSDVIRAAEGAGFETLDVENLRPHYALTCRAWVSRLQQNAPACLQFVDTQRYRTWLLYLAASALSFRTGHTDVYQILFTKRVSPHRRHLTRDYMYRSG